MNGQNVYAAPQSSVKDVVGGGGIMTENVVAALAKTRPWVLMFAILGFIGTAFMVIGGVGMIAGGAMMGQVSNEANTAIGGGFVVGMGAFYLIIAALYFFTSLHLFRYAGAIKRIKLSPNVVDLEAALTHQASFWKLVGIMVLVSIVLGIAMAVVMPSAMLMFAVSGQM